MQIVFPSSKTDKGLHLGVVVFSQILLSKELFYLRNTTSVLSFLAELRANTSLFNEGEGRLNIDMEYEFDPLHNLHKPK